MNGFEDDGERSDGSRNRRQEALLELLTHDDVTAGNFDAAIRTITEASAEILDVSRTNVWLFDESGSRLRCVDNYDRRAGEHTDLPPLVAANYPTYVDALRGNRNLAVSDAAADPRTAELCDYLEQNDVRSLLDGTLRAEGEVVGVVCNEHVGSTREWTEADEQFAVDIADVVHRALRNRRSRKRREQLAYRESLLKAQQEAIPDGLVVLGLDGGVLTYNDRFRELWNLEESVLADGSAAALLDRLEPMIERPDDVADRLARSLENPTERYEETLRLADGRVFEVIATPVSDDDGGHHGRLLVVRDVTERTENRAELERKNRAIDSAPIGITLADPSQPDNPLVYANDRFLELTGYPEAEILGRNCRFLQGEATDPEPVAELRAAIEAERPVSVELRNYRRDGSQFWNRVTVAPVEHDGEVVNYVGFQQDVTDRTETARQLKVLHRVLRHNLANQFTYIRGAAERIAAEAGDDVAETAAGIVDDVDDLIATVEKHREIVQLLSEQPSPRPVAVDDVLDRVADDLRESFPAAELSVARTGGTTARAIPALENALRELVENAIVHNDRERPGVDVDVTVDAETVELRIADDGPGIPESERAILQGIQEVEPLYHGEGLGLWVVYWIVTLSQGTLSVAENEPRGTSIRIELPRADGE